MRFVLLASLILCSTAANAQQEFFKDIQLETFATKSARTEYLQLLASEFIQFAPDMGLTPQEISIFAWGIRTASFTAKPSVPSVGAPLRRSIEIHSFAQVQTKLPDGRIETTRTKVGPAEIRQEQLEQVRTRLINRSFTILQKFATIQLIINPALPQDYNLKINGEDFADTGQTIFRVLPGNVTVNVVRAAKPPCTWEGTIAAGKQQLVSCSL